MAFPFELTIMNTINIQNFGPIGEGFGAPMPISPVTIFCGLQGAGKSSVAKLISTCFWLEKALVRGKIVKNKKTETPVFFRQQCEFHRIQNYFKADTEIDFKGTRYNFYYRNDSFVIESLPETEKYPMPKIIYVPAERNFISVVEHPETLKEFPASLFSLFSEFDTARKALKKDITLPIEGYAFQYDKLNNVSWLTGSDFKVRISEAASGFQSLTPMSVVIRYITHLVRTGKEATVTLQEKNAIDKRVASILADNTLDEQTRRLLLDQQSLLLKYGKSINIIEEPEQNLYPSSQRKVLYDLFEAYKETPYNQLIITTHSPYLLDYLTLSVKAASIKPKNEEQTQRLEAIVPIRSQVNGSEICVYQIENGIISPLQKYQDMPSDDNMLNQELGDTNELFAQLLEIEAEK